MARRGQPTLYKPEYAEQAKKLCDTMAATDVELAAYFDVSLRTLNGWKVRHPEFMQAIKMGKAPANERVAASLYHRAMGYSVVEQETRVIKGKVVVTDVIKHYPPDTTAMIFWLKNRESAQWSDKQEVQHTGTIELTDRILRARKNAEPEAD